MSGSAAKVILGKFHTISTCGSQTHIEVTTCESTLYKMEMSNASITQQNGEI